MRQEGLTVGLASGLILALAFIAGASALGPAVQHIDVLPSASNANTPPAGATLTGQAVAVGNAAPPTVMQSPSLSSVSALSTDGGATVALLFLPILTGYSSGSSTRTGRAGLPRVRGRVLRLS